MVSLADLDAAHAKDELTGKELTEFFLEEMLADPMVQLVMRADGVSAMQLRQIYSGKRSSEAAREVTTPIREARTPQDKSAIQAAENEGMPPRSN